MKNIKPLKDDERVPGWRYFLAGGVGRAPTGAQLRERKEGLEAAGHDGHYWQGRKRDVAKWAPFVGNVPFGKWHHRPKKDDDSSNERKTSTKDPHRRPKTPKTAADYRRGGGPGPGPGGQGPSKPRGPPAGPAGHGGGRGGPGNNGPQGRSNGRQGPRSAPEGSRHNSVHGNAGGNVYGPRGPAGPPGPVYNEPPVEVEEEEEEEYSSEEADHPPPLQTDHDLPQHRHLPPEHEQQQHHPEDDEAELPDEGPTGPLPPPGFQYVYPQDNYEQESAPGMTRSSVQSTGPHPPAAQPSGRQNANPRDVRFDTPSQQAAVGIAARKPFTRPTPDTSRTGLSLPKPPSGPRQAPPGSRVSPRPVRAGRGLHGNLHTLSELGSSARGGGADNHVDMGGYGRDGGEDLRDAW